jgi:N-formylglutamate amidohydrolase
LTPFAITAAARPSPVVVEVPHAGLEIPDALRGPTRPSDADVRGDADFAVDDLWRGAPGRGASLLVARLSRYVCDLNRHPDDVDGESVADHPSPRRRSPRGFVWHANTDGAPALERPLRIDEWRARRDQVWRPYHDALRRLLDEARARHGFALLVAAHSMPSIGRAMNADPGRTRADVVPGVRGGTSCAPAVLGCVTAAFQARGLRVSIDDPYRGGWTTSHYGRPAGSVHAIQIELSRALYMDESRHVVIEDKAASLRPVLDDLVERLAALVL